MADTVETALRRGLEIVGDPRDRALFDDEVIARLRGMLGDLARQLGDELALLALLLRAAGASLDTAPHDMAAGDLAAAIAGLPPCRATQFLAGAGAAFP
ncbi:MAG: hypothetical protein M3N34_04195 [Pseudomonadota bacterium]|nr:hypothetical protein [Pseudomonadota bacterium]